MMLLINNLPSAAYTGGLDFTQYFGKKTYMINLNTAFSYIEGTENWQWSMHNDHLQGIFKNPAIVFPSIPPGHHFQASGGRLQFMKSGNGHWSYGGAFLWKTPGLGTQ